MLFSLQEILGVLDASCIPQLFLFYAVLDFYPEFLSIAKIIHYLLVQVPHGENDVRKAFALEVLDGVFENGLSSEHEHGLGNRVRVRPQPRSLSSANYECLHFTLPPFKNRLCICSSCRASINRTVLLFEFMAIECV